MKAKEKEKVRFVIPFLNSGFVTDQFAPFPSKATGTATGTAQANDDDGGDQDQPSPNATTSTGITTRPKLKRTKSSTRKRFRMPSAQIRDHYHSSRTLKSTNKHSHSNTHTSSNARPTLPSPQISMSSIEGGVSSATPTLNPMNPPPSTYASRRRRSNSRDKSYRSLDTHDQDSDFKSYKDDYTATTGGTGNTGNTGHTDNSRNPSTSREQRKLKEKLSKYKKDQQRADEAHKKKLLEQRNMYEKLITKTKKDHEVALKELTDKYDDRLEAQTAEMSESHMQDMQEAIRTLAGSMHHFIEAQEDSMETLTMVSKVTARATVALLMLMGFVILGMVLYVLFTELLGVGQ